MEGLHAHAEVDEDLDAEAQRADRFTRELRQDVSPAYGVQQSGDVDWSFAHHS
ncbi:hypothetical protein [Streptomyces sp. NPDC013457]|uniref:hypothetical protein n=1 Tax=Streptomyces sp. NPDC013457 TaxID=3364866 RepID=UPI0036FDE047